MRGCARVSESAGTRSWHTRSTGRALRWQGGAARGDAGTRRARDRAGGPGAPPRPVTLIWGRHDPVNRLRIAETASQRYGWPLHVIEDAGDDPPMEQPEAFLHALRGAVAAATGGDRELQARLRDRISSLGGSRPGIRPMPTSSWRWSLARRRAASRRTERRWTSAPAARSGGFGSPGAAGTSQASTSSRRRWTRPRARREGAGRHSAHQSRCHRIDRGRVGSGYRLLLDTGTFHGLDDTQREAMGRT